jgi:hypothetical protein
MKLLIALILIPILVLFAACGQADEPADTGEPADNGTVASITLSQEDIDAARQVVYDYWDACNAYDPDAAIACLEDSYRQLREADIPGEIAQMQGAGVQLGVEEEAEPIVTADGTVLIQIKLVVPILADRHIIYEVVEVDGVWKICDSEEL